MPVGSTPVLVAKYERGHSRVPLAWCRVGCVLHAAYHAAPARAAVVDVYAGVLQPPPPIRTLLNHVACA